MRLFEACSVPKRLRTGGQEPARQALKRAPAELSLVSVFGLVSLFQCVHNLLYIILHIAHYAPYNIYHVPYTIYHIGFSHGFPLCRHPCKF